MFGSFFLLTLKGLRHRPTRSWLTILGVVIGIMLVVMILVLSNGIKNAVAGKLQAFGSNLIMIFPGKESNPLVGLFGNQGFRESDIENLKKIDGVDIILPVNVQVFNVEFQGEKKSLMAHGGPMKPFQTIMEQAQGVKLESGRWPTTDQANEVVVGYKVANGMFLHPVRVGDEITIKSKRMVIVGVISEIGSQSDDNSAYISLDNYRQLTGNYTTVLSTMVQVKPGVNASIVAQRIKYELGKQEVVKDFSVITAAKAGNLVGNVLSIIELGLIAIALISLLVGAVGIMNTMYTSVLERTKQIGIMKAIGATNESILTLFLIESGMIGLVGGVFGTLFGVLVAALIGWIGSTQGMPGLFDVKTLDYFGLIAMLFLTFLVGVMSGYLPARQAAKMQPAEALRYE